MGVQGEPTRCGEERGGMEDEICSVENEIVIVPCEGRSSDVQSRGPRRRGVEKSPLPPKTIPRAVYN